MIAPIVGYRRRQETAANGRETADSPRARRSGGQPEAQSGPDSLWTVGDAAAYLKLPIGSIYKMTGAKAVIRIPHVRVGKTVRFRKADIDRWLALQTVSNLDVLERTRSRALRASHGHD